MGKNKKPVPVEYDECRAKVIFKPSSDSVHVVKEYIRYVCDVPETLHSESYDLDLRTMTLQTALGIAVTFVQNMSLVDYVSDENDR